MKQNDLIKLEELEYKYLRKYYFFLKSVEDEILEGLETKNDIKDDWFLKWSTSDDKARKSDFSTGAERVIYALINSKAFGTPNSCPVGSDLMFEMEKTTQVSNIGDFATKFTLGNNQISYNATYTVSGKDRDYKNANLPTIYTKNGNIKKPCLTYFLNILHDEETLKVLFSYITCFPNGILSDVYRGDVFNAGKLVTDVRANVNNLVDFKLINAKRTLVLYQSAESTKFKKELKFLLELSKNQNVF